METQFVWLKEDVFLNSRYRGTTSTLYWQCQDDQLLVLVEHAGQEILRVHECPQCYTKPQLRSATEALAEIRRVEALAALLSGLLRIPLDEATTIAARKQIAAQPSGDIAPVTQKKSHAKAAALGIAALLCGVAIAAYQQLTARD